MPIYTGRTLVLGVLHPDGTQCIFIADSQERFYSICSHFGPNLLDVLLSPCCSHNNQMIMVLSNGWSLLDGVDIRGFGWIPVAVLVW